jgi:hypothetical protein
MQCPIRASYVDTFDSLVGALQERTDTILTYCAIFLI